MKNIENKVQHFLSNFYPNTEIALGYIVSGKVYFKGFLKTDRSIKIIKNSTRLFEIGSITKVFTSNILAQLLIEGKTTKDTFIADILSIKSLKRSKITLEQLANHTSGLPRLPDNFYTIKNYDKHNPYKSYDETALIDFFQNHLVQPPIENRAFLYSNLGSGILGYVLSKIENKSFHQVVHQRIFEPLKMNDSYFGMNTKKNSVIGLNKDGQVADNWEGGILSGGIGITSSVKDMSKFMIHILDKKNKVSTLQLAKTYPIEENHSIGLGWGIRDLPDGTKSYNHGGGSDGYSCYMKLHRASQSGVILLSNISAFHKCASQVNDLVSQLREGIRKHHN